MFTNIIQFNKRKIQIKHMAIVDIYQNNRNVQIKEKILNFILDLQCKNPQ